jgi:hypothetical protein
MLKAIRGIYNSSNQMYFQGKKAELKKKEKEGYRVVGGSNGTYILAQPAEAIILLEDEETGKTIMADAKDEIRRIYNVERVTEKKLDMLVESIQSGKMEAFYTDEEGLRVEPKAK